MCLAAPARVVSLGDGDAVVELGGRRFPASTLFAADVRVGDWVVINGGAIVRRVDPEQAERMARAFRIATSPAPEAGEERSEAG